MEVLSNSVSLLRPYFGVSKKPDTGQAGCLTGHTGHARPVCGETEQPSSVIEIGQTEHLTGHTSQARPLCSETERQANQCSGSVAPSEVKGDPTHSGVAKVRGHRDAPPTWHSNPLSHLLSQQISSDDFVRELRQLPGGRAAEVMEKLCTAASCGCLLWARCVATTSVVQ